MRPIFDPRAQVRRERHALLACARHAARAYRPSSLPLALTVSVWVFLFILAVM